MSGTDPLVSVRWVDGGLELIDQTLLPGELVVLRLDAVDAVVEAIQRLAVRGAPAIGLAGAFGVRLAAERAERERWPAERLTAAVRSLREARPTAVNLAWAVDRVAARLVDGCEAVAAEADAVFVENDRAGAALVRRGADLVESLVPGPVTALTHCNTGPLACGTWGTALGVLIELHRRGRISEVIACETRPLLQGARLTVWELARAGVPHRLAVDGAGPALIERGLVDLVIVGADRIAVNGDVCNKIGTFSHACAAHRAGVPFVVAAPESTLDPATPSGAEIVVEERAAEEVVAFGGHPVAPASTPVINPAFDVTPADLITAIVTEARVLTPWAVLSRGQGRA